MAKTEWYIFKAKDIDKLLPMMYERKFNSIIGNMVAENKRNARHKKKK